MCNTSCIRKVMYIRHKGNKMQELIKIEQKRIGSETVNSINARDLHKSLESKKDFSNWIKAQINTLGLEENIDFVRFAQKVEANNATKKEYIITTDTAKHIAMASRTLKGKEIRRYFIKIEKSYKLITAENEKFQLHILEQNKVLAQKLDTMHIQQIQMKKEITDISRGVGQNTFLHVNESIQEITTVLRNMPLDVVQLDMIKEAVQLRADVLVTRHGLARKVIVPHIYRETNERFNARSYHQIKREHFKQALDYIAMVEVLGSTPVVDFHDDFYNEER